MLFFYGPVPPQRPPGCPSAALAYRYVLAEGLSGIRHEQPAPRATSARLCGLVTTEPRGCAGVRLCGRTLDALGCVHCRLTPLVACALNGSEAYFCLTVLSSRGVRTTT